MTENAERTAALVSMHRRAGIARRRRRVPRPQYPKLVESDYAKALVSIIREVKSLLAPVLLELPKLLADAARARGDASGAGLARTTRSGFDIVIESPAGSVRRWVDTDGTPGETIMRFDYGYIDGFLGTDGEDVDVYLGPTADPEWVFIIHQQSKASGFTEYDEDKVMLGWGSPSDALAAYLAQYDDQRFVGGSSAFRIEDFRARMTEAPGRKIVHADENRVDIGEGRKARHLLDLVRDKSGSLAVRTERIAESAATRVSSHQKETFQRQMRAALGVEIQIPDRSLASMVEHFASENVALIKSLAGKSLDEVEKLITRGFTEGRRAEDLEVEIRARFDISERHARLIARDQIGKLNAQIARSRHQEVGIARFRWCTMRDRAVRVTHQGREGKVYSYAGKDAPPSLPGQEVCCRCGEEPVFDDLLALLD